MDVQHEAAVALSDAHGVLSTVASLHRATDAGELVEALLHHLARLIRFEGAEWSLDGSRSRRHGADRRAAPSPAAMPHRLLISSGAGARPTLRLVLGRSDDPFALREVAIARLVQPHLAGALDHVRLRAAAVSPARLLDLTVRERQVLVQVAEGWTNRDIARTLFIEARTVEKHVEHIRTKLGARSRAEAAAVWARAMSG